MAFDGLVSFVIRSETLTSKAAALFQGGGKKALIQLPAGCRKSGVAAKGEDCYDVPQLHKQREQQAKALQCDLPFGGGRSLGEARRTVISAWR